MMKRFLLVAVITCLSLTAHAQIPAPQINLSGNIGCQGFPCVNSGTLIMASDANRTMTAQETSAQYIKVTSSVSLTATRNLIAPTGRFNFTIENSTTGGQSIQIIGTSGTGVIITNGGTVSVWNDGTNFVQSTNGPTTILVNSKVCPLGTQGCTISTPSPTLSGSVVSVSATNESLWPGATILPDGKALAIYQIGVVGTVLNTQLLTKSGTTVAVSGSPVSVTIPAGYTVDDQSLTLLTNGTLFMAVTLVQTSSGNFYPSYQVCTIGGGDALTCPGLTILNALTGLPSGYTNLVQDPSPVIQTGVSSLLLPIYAQKGAGFQVTGFINLASFIGGTPSAFTQIGPNPTTNNQYNESCGVVWPDSSMTLVIRHTIGGVDPAGSLSSSLSSSSLSPSFPNPTDNVVNTGGVVGRPSCYTPDNKTLVVVSRCAVQNSSESGDTTCAEVSYDKGRTFSAISDVGMGGGQDNYDALIQWTDGTLGLFQSFLNVPNSAAVIGYSNLTLQGVNVPAGQNLQNSQALNLPLNTTVGTTNSAGSSVLTLPCLANGANGATGNCNVGTPGTVTTVSVATANGFQGTVANPTTTPAISVNVDSTHVLPTNTGSTSTFLNGAGAYTTPAGTGITALTGDGTASGTGSVALTLATVNSGPGACGDATHVCAVTTNGKGLTTAQTSTTISGIATSGTQYGMAYASATGPPIVLTTTTAPTTAIATGYFPCWLPAGTPIAPAICNFQTVLNTATVAAANGGTGINTSASTGCPSIASGTWSVVTCPTTSIPYPGAGIPNSTGSAWGTSYGTSGSGSTVALTNAPTFTTASFSTNSGTVLTLGSGGGSTATPVSISTGNTFSSTPGANPKFITYSTNFGIGVSGNGQDYIVPIGNVHGFYVNGTLEASVTSIGASAATYSTFTNCSSSASPAVCGSAAAGSVVIAAGSTTVTVNTTAVTANSQIIVEPDDSLSTKLGVTCNSTLSAILAGSGVTARVAGTSFTISTLGTIVANPACYSYTIVN